MTPEELPTNEQIAQLTAELVRVSERLEKLSKDVDRLEGKANDGAH